jgi:hypothetical protein
MTIMPMDKNIMNTNAVNSQHLIFSYPAILSQRPSVCF